IRQATEALEKAEHLAPADPKVLAARGAYSLLIRNDPAAALQAFRSARSAGLADALWLQLMADTLVTLGHVEEAVDVSLESLAMDPRNASVVTLHAIRLARLHRPIEAQRILERAVPELPETTVLPILSKQLYFWHTGELEPFHALVRQHGFEVGFTPSTGVDEAEALRREAEYLRLGGRIGDLQALLDGHRELRLRSRHQGAGDEPLAEMQGWASLLANDHAGAAAAGSAITQFLDDTRETEWNRAYRMVLGAASHVFAGEPARAAETA